ncbi:TetR/AcrR family transcriptional regulator [Chengkuizengella axinellae]|uniref:TetR/AcrR family transcriptional regulator n=1 Tax=Chengkuizengella axinellae TaxID=3064388 RepID=A0ABT9J0R4_9BACL|nr:TetR/AcrR family transcriptional regulator [Chengkuizengella sp. 2205SS18-9]MDP5275183.1 TetR/AcrR family transcriptional regulator [Chengkuizengella sp. 2205SS18-9]
MNEKKKNIMESAMILISQKGYHATSMKEIADHIGMAKGSIYNYFDSKEDLMISLLRYYFDPMYEKVEKVRENECNLSPKEMFTRQMMVQIEQQSKYKEFIKMIMREQVSQINDEIKEFMFKIRAKTINWATNHVIEIYGDNIKKYAYDLATILIGMMREFMIYIIIDKKNIEIERLPNLLISVLDQAVDSFKANDHVPFLSEDIMENYIHMEKELKKAAIIKIKSIINEIKLHTSKLDLNMNLKAKVSSSLEAITEEIEQEDPRLVVIEGLMLYLHNTGVSELEDFLKEINSALISLN